MTGAKSCENCGHPSNPERKYTPPTECREREVHGAMHWICSDCESAGAPLLKPVVVAPDFGTRDNHYGSETSAQAANQAANDAKLNDTHRRILGQLCISPATPDEISLIMRLNWSTARARMTDLKNAGLITSTGETRTAQGGKEANVMRPTTPNEREQEQAA